MISIVSLLVSSLSWSFFDLMRKHLATRWTPLALTLCLTLGVLPFYTLFWLISGDPIAQPGYWWPAICGIALAAMAAVLFVKALSLGDMAKLLPILALTPIVATITGGFLLQESLNITQWLAMIVTVVAIVGVQGGLHHTKGTGFILMLIVSFCWGVGTVLDKMALQYSGPMFHGVFQNIGIAVLLGLVMLRKPEKLFHGPLLPLIPALALFMLAVVGQWIALKGLDSGIVEIVKRSIGIIGALVLGAFIFKEKIRPPQVIWCGVIVIALAVVLSPEF